MACKRVTGHLQGAAKRLESNFALYTILEKSSYIKSPLALLTKAPVGKGGMMGWCVAPVYQNGISMTPEAISRLFLSIN
ncbi:hypothetical protein PCC7418_0124 [Halothece sp. PCC 7418]|nr:hypothetical protein PCC7418_0124 [Halothece sp. PCC 7418]